MMRGLFFTWIISMLIIFPQLSQCGENYQIVEREDLSYRSLSSGTLIKRLSYRIKVEPPITKDKLRSICNTIISTQSSGIKTISFLFYLSDTEVNGPYTAGKAEWAPNGRWQDAESTSPPQLEIILAEITSYKTSSVSVLKKKRIFLEVIAAQDGGIMGKEAERYVAKKHGLSAQEVCDICDEGMAKNWPMP